MITPGVVDEIGAQGLRLLFQGGAAYAVGRLEDEVHVDEEDCFNGGDNGYFAHCRYYWLGKNVVVW